MENFNTSAQHCQLGGQSNFDRVNHISLYWQYIRNDSVPTRFLITHVAVLTGSLYLGCALCSELAAAYYSVFLVDIAGREGRSMR